MTSTRKVVSVLGKGTGPTLDLNFINGRQLDSRINFTRSSAAYYYDATGTLQQAASNVPRIDYGPTPGGVTNWIRNSTMQGAVAGTPGTPPTNWAFIASAGLVWSVVGTGTESGIPYVDVRFSGTGSGFCYLNAVFEGNTVVSATSGQTWTTSAYIKLAGGSTSGLSKSRWNIEGWQNASTGAEAGTVDQSLPTSAPLASQRPVGTYTLGNASTNYTRSYFQLIAIAGTPVDITLRIGAPQLEQSSVANVWVPTYGSAANVGATPLGLLIEESRTNSIRNPRCEGAVAGTPGTMPTNWLVTGVPTGASLQVVGSGTEAGIPYVDLRFFGTPTAAAPIGIFAESAGGIAAANGQTWAESQYIRVVGGSLSGLDTVELRIRFNNSSGTPLADAVGTLVTPTTAGLATQRVLYARTASDATTAYAQPYIRVGTINGSAFDVTLRIGAPQMEQGAFATSPMLPAAGSPAAFSRAADVASMPVGSWFNPAAMSLATEAMRPNNIPVAASSYVVAFDDGTTQNRIAQRIGSTLSTPDGVVGVAGSFAFSSPGVSVTAGAPFKIASSFRAGAQATSVNGSAVGTSASVLPKGITTLRFGGLSTTDGTWNGYLRRTCCWRRGLGNSELIADTT